MHAHRLIIAICVTTIYTASVYAEKVYRSVDEKGVVEFSDQGKHGSEEMEVPAVPTYQFKKVERPATTSKQKVAEISPLQIQILSPAAKETIHHNLGDVTVTMKISDTSAKATTGPETNAKSSPKDVAADQKATRADGLKEGEKIVIYLDGNKRLETENSTLVLNNVDRGTHQLKVSIIDATGKQVAESQQVEFYVKRASKLFKPPVTPVKTN